jgi:hypothetical protein
MYVLKGRQFESVEMKGNLLVEQRGIPKKAFQECSKTVGKAGRDE